MKVNPVCSPESASVNGHAASSWSQSGPAPSASHSSRKKYWRFFRRSTAPSRSCCATSSRAGCTSMPVSSRNSRAAAAGTDSSASTRPPGNWWCIPFFFLYARRRRRPCVGWTAKTNARCAIFIAPDNQCTASAAQLHCCWFHGYSIARTPPNVTPRLLDAGCTARTRLCCWLHGCKCCTFVSRSKSRSNARKKPCEKTRDIDVFDRISASYCCPHRSLLRARIAFSLHRCRACCLP